MYMWKRAYHYQIRVRTKIRINETMSIIVKMSYSPNDIVNMWEVCRLSALYYIAHLTDEILYVSEYITPHYLQMIISKIFFSKSAFALSTMNDQPSLAPLSDSQPRIFPFLILKIIFFL